MICVYCSKTYGEVSAPLDSYGCCKECEEVVDQVWQKYIKEREGKDENI